MWSRRHAIGVKARVVRSATETAPPRKMVAHATGVMALAVKVGLSVCNIVLESPKV